MLARLSSASLRGLDAEAVDVEVDLSRGLPCWSLVGRIKSMFFYDNDCYRLKVLNRGYAILIGKLSP